MLVLPAGVTVTSVWNANVKRSGQTFMFTKMDRMGALSPGASASFGFEADGSDASPQSCTVNGQPCG